MEHVLQAFKDFKALVENQTGLRIKRFCYDNGTGEYTNELFKAFLREKGINKEPSPPYEHWFNGVVERKIRTVEETARCLLFQANLPDWLWPEAIDTAVYLRNRSPTSALSNKTPFEAYTGRKPEISHLKSFGCTAHAHLHKGEQRGPGKFAPRSHECILIGYVEGSGQGSTIYKLFNAETKRVFTSGSVDVDEHSFPGYAGSRSTSTATKRSRPAERPAEQEADRSAETEISRTDAIAEEEEVYDTIHVVRRRPAEETTGARIQELATPEETTSIEETSAERPRKRQRTQGYVPPEKTRYGRELRQPPLWQ